TELARDILHPSNESDRKAKLRTAALTPALFGELLERFPGHSVPPEDGVITYLNRQGFNPNAVRHAARAFLQTMSHLEQIGAFDSHAVTPTGGQNLGGLPSDEERQTETPAQPVKSAQPTGLIWEPAPAGFRREVFTLDEGEVVLTFPDSISPASFHDLNDHLR